MEVAQHRWRLRWSFKDATIIVNMITALFLLQSFFYSSSSTTPSERSNGVKHSVAHKWGGLMAKAIKKWRTFAFPSRVPN
ncbi:hypothetical protein RND71_022518 [Anisodus tanguticus]|uniref:Uncharacterized protein n=1 Tax=Anisodus tanguticus TaxID=243964 RepID=A0AAE1RS60_9SOLA|nr:hypothetical protein RND71_022518 [Anisodus tanguticus]